MKIRVTLTAVMEYDSEDTFEQEVEFYDEDTDNFWECHGHYNGTTDVKVEKLE